jgi:hypothetical protein
MSKVVAFRENTIPGEPNADVIEDLERLLSEARSGELEAVAYCTVRKGIIGTGWVGGSGTRGSISSAILMLGHRYADALLGGNE